MNTTVGYCAGCNERFELKGGDTTCPLCHRHLKEVDLEAETLKNYASTVSLGHHRSKSKDLVDRLMDEELGGYRITSFLGRGGMAWVFKAEHLKLRRDCAIKILCPWLKGGSDKLVEMFIDEARSAASITHPHIVEVHNMGEAGNYHFIELEYVPGRSLQDIIHSEGKLSTLESVDYLHQAAAALAEAHRVNMVHRDIKPSNMLVRPDGFLKLADFGLAKRITLEGQVTHAQERRALSGTPNFMAPELFDHHEATFQSDAYAMGVCLFYMLTGAFPFTGDTLRQVRRSHREDPIPDPGRYTPGLPDIVADFIVRCLSKEVSGRPRHGIEMRDELRGILATLRDLPSLVQEAFVADENLDITYGETMISVRVPLKGNRYQTVFISEAEVHGQSTPLLRIFSTCGEATPDIYERALAVNKDLPFGTCGIDTIGGKKMLIMLSTVPHGACEPRHIRRSVYELAQQADFFEVLLGDGDYH